jgi:hypothetical protein
MPNTLPQLEPKLVTERQIWDWAGDLIEAHSELAAIEGSKLADECLERGDLYGPRIWLRVVKAIAAMTDNEGEIAN